MSAFWWDWRFWRKKKKKTHQNKWKWKTRFFSMSCWQVLFKISKTQYLIPFCSASHQHSEAKLANFYRMLWRPPFCERQLIMRCIGNGPKMKKIQIQKPEPVEYNSAGWNYFKNMSGKYVCLSSLCVRPVIIFQQSQAESSTNTDHILSLIWGKALCCSYLIQLKLRQPS